MGKELWGEKGKMKTDLFGNPITLRETIKPRGIEIYIFADERKKVGNRWDYIAILVVPAEKISEALRILTKHREEVGYYRELKFSQIKKAKGEKFNLANRWLQEIIDDGKLGRDIFHFNILGIDRSNLQPEYLKRFF